MTLWVNRVISAAGSDFRFSPEADIALRRTNRRSGSQAQIDRSRGYFVELLFADPSQ